MTIFKNIAFHIFCLIIIFVNFTACKNKYKVETDMIDSLIRKNLLAEDFINIDLITINQRRIEMKAQIAVLSSYVPDSSALEFESNFIKYKAIFKSYKKFIENYDLVRSKVKLNERQLSSLKNSVIDKKITGAEFKIAIDRETRSVNENLMNAEILGNTIFKLEPDYQRLSKYFDSFVSKLINISAENKKIYDENTEK